MKKNIDARYEVMVYDGRAIDVNTVTREQALAIDPRSVDYHLSLSLGKLAFRTADGRWIERRGADWQGLGDVGIRIIQALQLNPGEWLTPAQVADITGRDSLDDSKVLSARLLALRNIHGESFKQPHFFLSRKAGGFSIAWSPDRTWMSIERIG
jgi:hypothetical protein